jgi:hypothetical protein
MLAQVVAPSAASVATSQDGAAGFAFCKPHAAQAENAPDAVRLAGSEQRPAGEDPRHDHHSCSICQLGMSATPLDPLALFSFVLNQDWRRSKFVPRVEPVLSFRFNRGAPARAPPSFL